MVKAVPVSISAVTDSSPPNLPVPATIKLPSVALLGLFFICVSPVISAPPLDTVNLSPKIPVPATVRLPSVALLELLLICILPFIPVVPVILVGLFIVTGTFAVILPEFTVSLPLATFKLGVLMLVVADRVSVVKLALIGTPALFSILLALIGSLALASSFKA